MVLKKFLNVSVSLLLLSSLTGCASWLSWFGGDTKPETKVITETKYIKPNIPIQIRPRAVDLQDVHFYVVTADTFNDFKTRFEAENGQFVFFAITVQDYEKLALNLADIKRYIEQQKSIIIFYEKAITETPKQEQK